MEGSPLNVTKLLYLCKAPWVTKRTDLRIVNKCPSSRLMLRNANYASRFMTRDQPPRLPAFLRETLISWDIYIGRGYAAVLAPRPRGQPSAIHLNLIRDCSLN